MAQQKITLRGWSRKHGEACKVTEHKPAGRLQLTLTCMAKRQHLGWDAPSNANEFPRTPALPRMKAKDSIEKMAVSIQGQTVTGRAVSDVPSSARGLG